MRGGGGAKLTGVFYAFNPEKEWTDYAGEIQRAGMKYAHTKNDIRRMKKCQAFFKIFLGFAARRGRMSV
jgi:hypothetical protein